MVFAVGSMKYFSMSKWKHKFVVEVTQMNSPAKPKISKKFNLSVLSLFILKCAYVLLLSSEAVDSLVGFLVTFSVLLKDLFIL